MSVVITSCTNRKRIAPAQGLTASRLRRGDLKAVAAAWEERLRSADRQVLASDLYCGRGFRQAEGAAITERAGFFVVSAGLGFVPATARVPSYSLTVAAGSADNILSRISGAMTAADWWKALARTSPYGQSIAKAVEEHKGPILVALPAGYLGMIAHDLLALPARTRSRLRIFTLTPPEVLPEGLRSSVMPYNSRFDGADTPVAGTRSDFAQRSLAHFVEAVLPKHPRADFEGHADAVEKLLSGFRRQEMPVRLRRTDAEIAQLIRRHWSDVDGQSSRMLRFLRDELGIACEQGRFRGLFLAFKEKRGAN